MSLKSLRLPDELAREIDEIAARRRTTGSNVIREAVARYCEAVRNDVEDDPFLMIEDEPSYGGSGRGDLAESSEAYLRERFGARRRDRTR